MKRVVCALLAAIGLSVTGGASPQPLGCCREPPVSDFVPQWSSDGSRIAFVRENRGSTAAFMTIARDGGEVRPLVSIGYDFRPNGGTARLSPDWSDERLDAALRDQPVGPVPGDVPGHPVELVRLVAEGAHRGRALQGSG